MKRWYAFCLIMVLLFTGCGTDDRETSSPLSSVPIVTAPIVTDTEYNEMADVIDNTSAIFVDSYFEVFFIDVGQADAALVRCDDQTMLIDGGNAADSDLIFTFLRNQGVGHLDYIISTHAHEDHVGGLAGALHAATAGVIYSPVMTYDTKAFGNLIKAAEGQDVSLSVPEAGTMFELGSAEVYVLGPLHEYEEVNNTSIVIKIIYGETSFLFTGDMEREAELDLIDAGIDLTADVLKTGHHGSNTSSSYVFVYEVMPAYAIISCGKSNTYGHPHEVVLSRLRDADVEIFRTDMQGTITCTSDGISVLFDTERNRHIQTNPTEEPIYEDAGEYIGNVNSKKLHIPTCRTLPAEHNREYFSNLEEAYNLGYTGCGNCMK